MSDPKELLETLIGSWQGTCRTWFEPGKLADESAISGEIVPILGGLFVRHTYQSTIQGRPRSGEETIAFNSVTSKFQIAWVDDFHMNYAVMLSDGPASDDGFTVSGPYDVSPDSPPWGWKTVFQLSAPDQLTIIAYNVSPNGEEAKAVETTYQRNAPE